MLWPDLLGCKLSYVSYDDCRASAGSNRQYDQRALSGLGTVTRGPLVILLEMGQR